MDEDSQCDLLEEIANSDWDDDSGESPINANALYQLHGGWLHTTHEERWEQYCSDVRDDPDQTFPFEEYLAEDFSQLAVTLPKCTTLFRARRGFRPGEYSERHPFAGDEIGAPPTEEASPGRVNVKGAIGINRNPVSLVVVQGASKRLRKPRSLTVEQFHQLSDQLREPYQIIASMCVCFGLRISESLALRWSDVDWLDSKLRVERGIVRQIVDDVKTDNSRKTFAIADELLVVLRAWKQQTQFSVPEDWMFASPLKLGRLPYSYTGVWRELQRAADAAGIGHLGTPAFRHSYRAWLRDADTPLELQRQLMRHSDIRTTMLYGDVLMTEEMQQVNRRVAALALSRPA